MVVPPTLLRLEVTLDTGDKYALTGEKLTAFSAYLKRCIEMAQASGGRHEPWYIEDWERVPSCEPTA